MFEIGSSLRAARMRQELELSHVERDTRIRAKYLRAQEEAAPPPQLRIRHRRRFALAPWLVVVALLAASIAVLAWRLSGKSSHHASPAPSTAQKRTTTRAALPAAPRTATQPQTVARIVLVARRGRCWLSIHLGSATGRLVYQGTLEQGRTARFVSTRLWIRFGAPWNLDATVNGKAVQLPASTGDVVVTPTGLRATNG